MSETTNVMNSEVVKRLLCYVSYDTQSKDESSEVPSTQKQFDLAKVLKKELEEIGASDVRLSDHCYVYAKIPSNLDKKVPAIGFIAHMDTSPALSGKDIKPQIIQNYDGGVIKLGESGFSMGPNEFPALAELKGKSLITTDGTTLLGADDKAGVAEIMTMAAFFLAHPEVKHGDICIAFTPDEEVGNGVEYFDVPGFGADFAYTVDGGSVGEIEYENFNAANLRVEVQGYGIHPGSAKGKMKNAIRMAMEFEQMLTVFDNPEYTDVVCNMMNEILNDKTSPILEIINKDTVQEIVDTKGKAYKTPWFGQLMTGPQMIAYLIQVDIWLREYNVNILI